MGLVTDSTSAIVPGAAVKLIHQESGFSYTAVTNEEGLYRIPYLNPGNYQASFEAQGFKRLVRSGILIRSTETTRADVTLEVGTVVETVEIKSQTALLETETSTVGHLVTGATLNTIPTPQMKIQTILFYMPGVTSQSGDGHVAGQRSRSFNATMDGVSGMEPVRGSIATDRFLATVEHNMAEVKILTTALPAEYGHSGGGVMNISYKSGTNQLHGLADERYRHPTAVHRSWEEPNPLPRKGFHLMSGSLSGPVVLPKIYNGRNRTFFLVGFQRHHENGGENNNRNVPSPQMLAGDFSFGGIGDTIYDPATLAQLPNGAYTRRPFAGNVIPRNRFDPAVQKFLALNPYRAPDNRNNQAFVNRQGPQNNLSADTKYKSYRTGTDFKIDHSFSDHHKMFGRFSNYRHRASNGRDQIQWANKLFDYNWTPVPIDQKQLAIWDTITISPTTISEIRFGANRRKFTRIPETLGQNWAGQLGIPNANPETFPGFLDANGAALFGARFPEGENVDVTENFSFQENVTMVRGRHTFKTGYELLRTRANSSVNSEPSGRYRFGGTELPFTPNTGHPFASFLLGGVVRADFTQDLATWLPRWWTHSLYFQDDWKATPTLTLNLGLRWQYETPYSTKYGQQSQFSPDAIDSLTPRPGALLHPKGPLSRRDLNNFQPRLGMAYNFKKDWVFRAGFAVNTLDLWTNGLQENFEEYLATAVVQPPPGNPDVAFYLSKGPPPIQFSAGQDGTAPFVGANFTGRNASYYDPNIRSPYILNWNAGFQWQLSSTMVVEITYQGSSGVGLLNRWDINQIPLDISRDFNQLDQIRRAAQNFKPWPHFGSIFHYSNYGHNSFHSGTVKLEKRYSHGLTLTTFYSRSKAIDEDSDDAAASGVTFYNRRLEKARSDYDVSDRWVTYTTYELPFGQGRRFLPGSNRFVNGVFGNWRVGVIQTLEAGAPYGFTHTGSSNVFLPGALRPDLKPGVTYGDIKLSWDRHGQCRHMVACQDPWTDINAFAYPASFTPGQAGRNIISGPGVLWHQLSAAKSFPFRERLTGTLRVDVNNPFKVPFFGFPGSVVDFRNPQSFGKITSTRGVTSGLGASKLFIELHFKVEF
ncbi:MAG: carboxypeptidase regulatory-like domain-containing protein [Bryobacteraceae bacterium]